MENTVKHIPASATDGEFTLEQGGRGVARLDYTLEGDTLVIDYVEVSPTLRGGGVGMIMVDAAVAYARDRGLKVRPLCSYAKALMVRGETKYGDVLKR